jgi:hypothetical protein
VVPNEIAWNAHRYLKKQTIQYNHRDIEAQIYWNPFIRRAWKLSSKYVGSLRALKPESHSSIKAMN